MASPPVRIEANRLTSLLQALLSSDINTKPHKYLPLCEKGKMSGLPLIPGDAAFPNAESASRHSSPVDPRPYDPGMLGLPHI